MSKEDEYLDALMSGTIGIDPRVPSRPPLPFASSPSRTARPAAARSPDSAPAPAPPSPPPVMRLWQDPGGRPLEEGVRLGVQGASDAAARARPDLGLNAPAPSPSASLDTSAFIVERPRCPPLDLLWLDEAAAEPMRSSPHLAQDPRPNGLADELDVAEWFDGDAPEEGTPDLRSFALAALSRGRVQRLCDLGGLLRREVDETPGARPVVAVEGLLTLRLDPNTALLSTLTVVGPYAATSKQLEEVVALAERATRAGKPLPSPMALSLCDSLQRAFRECVRGLPKDHVEEVTTPALLEVRAYWRRSLFGAGYLVAKITDEGPSRATSEAQRRSVPVYLPEAVANELPLSRAFSTRLLAELRFRQDDLEASPVALRVLALARRLDGLGGETAGTTG